MSERLSIRDALASFAEHEPLEAALFLTYSFDGRWFEEALVPDLCERTISRMLVLRDRNALTSEAPSVRYRKANACVSRVFHPKLALVVTESSARAVIGSANLTRGGFERQRELGRVYTLGPSDLGDHGVFTSLIDYLENGISTEARGDSARDLSETARALRRVVGRHKAPSGAASNFLLHNYTKTIWDQLLERLPHRVLRRVVVMSPFYEPDRSHPEDPSVGLNDESIFNRLFTDFDFDPPKGEKPVRVLFRQSEGYTELPIRKLKNVKNRIAFFAQDEREQRLHAKLLLLEGADGDGREGFLAALHGSPNFTAAALLSSPPNGNSELAVLTMLPAKRGAFDRTIHVLDLESGFTRIDDLSGLRSEESRSPPTRLTQGIGDATYRITDRVLKIWFLHELPADARVRVLLHRDGGWVDIGSAVTSGASDIEMPAEMLASTDETTKLVELRATAVRIKVVSAQGNVISDNTVPINVDVPEEFCGLSLVGTALLSLDERIARAGMGVPSTYREQQKWLESRKSQDPAATEPSAASHHADLDRFYRNVHQGLRGLLARAKANPASEFTARRILDELTRWACEAAVEDAAVMSQECRLFLVERLVRAVRLVVDGFSATPRNRLPAIATDLHITERLEQLVQWLGRINEPALTSYAVACRSQARQIAAKLDQGVSR